jgi:hypothetical protein
VVGLAAPRDQPFHSFDWRGHAAKPPPSFDNHDVPISCYYTAPTQPLDIVDEQHHSIKKLHVHAFHYDYKHNIATPWPRHFLWVISGENRYVSFLFIRTDNLGHGPRLTADHSGSDRGKPRTVDGGGGLVRGYKIQEEKKKFSYFLACLSHCVTLFLSFLAVMATPKPKMATRNAGVPKKVVEKPDFFTPRIQQKRPLEGGGGGSAEVDDGGDEKAEEEEVARKKSKHTPKSVAKTAALLEKEKEDKQNEKKSAKKENPKAKHGEKQGDKPEKKEEKNEDKKEDKKEEKKVEKKDDSLLAAVFNQPAAKLQSDPLAAAHQQVSRLLSTCPNYSLWCFVCFSIYRPFVNAHKLWRSFMVENLFG